MKNETIDLTNTNVEFERRIAEAKGWIPNKEVHRIDQVFNTLVYANKIKREYNNIHEL